MVMETPSPQCVGREFVRQYYTLLHEAPLHLHRFYSHNSSYIHGGVEKPGEEQPPVQGQHEIHKKIVSLNFRDCYAKIRQVDSQATVGSAVVVQVTGELSNNGQPMRRFMQTFVLAPQSPKKYYVHNDIFRYQDEVFNDSDSEEAEIQEDTLGTDSENELMESLVVQAAESIGEPVVTSYYESQSPISNGTSHMEEYVEPVLPQAVAAPLEPDTEPSSTTTEEMGLEDDSMVDQGGFQQTDTDHVKLEEHDHEPQLSDRVLDLDIEQQPAEQKPFSWAGIASKNTVTSGGGGGGGGGGVGSNAGLSYQGPSFIQKSPPSRTSEPKPDHGPPSPQPQRQRMGRDPQQQQQQSQQPSQQQQQQTSFPPRDRDRVSLTRGESSDQDSDSMSSRRTFRAPDSCQLFVGNLPQHISEKDLKIFFEKYGTVIDLRINATKAPTAKVPNFGFVVFDSQEPVKAVLQSKPIYLNEHRLNVEEKKTKDGGGRGGGMGRGGPGRGMGMGGGIGGHRGGYRGGGGSRGLSSGGPRGGGFGVPRR